MNISNHTRDGEDIAEELRLRMQHIQVRPGYIPRTLHTESFRGNISNIRKYLSKQHNVNEKHREIGLSPLHLAAINGQSHACEYLLSNGADPNSLAESDCYPYLQGFISDNTEFYSNDCKDASPLRLAILFKQSTCVKILLKSHIQMTEKELKRCLKLAFDDSEIEPLMLECVAERLIRKYPNLQLQVKFCYKPNPAKTRILIAYSNHIYSDVEDNILDVDICIQNPNLIDKDSITVETTKENNYKIKWNMLANLTEAINLYGDNLFRKHSNLNIISTSAVRLGKTGKIKKGPCVVLYCATKGIIPLNENFFPTFLKVHDGIIKTDVREGYFSMCPGGVSKTQWNNPLRSGASIGIKGDFQGATIGPFVQLRDGSIGFITCAHLFCNVSGDCKTFVVQPSDIELVDSDISDAERVCGFLVEKVFDPKRTVSIDAALVKINARIPARGLFAIGSKLELKEAGFDVEQIPVFDSGNIKSTISPDDALKPVIKFGSSTGLTKGAFRMDGAQVRIKKDTDLTTPNNQMSFTMKGQYEIQTVGPKDFFQPGDSGSGVYIVDENKNLHCIGIAIGCTSYRSAIVTPIRDVLEALRLPRKLKSFTPQSMSE